MSRLVPPGAAPITVQLDNGHVRVLRSAHPHNGTVPAVLIHGGGSDNSGISWFRAFAPLAQDREVLAIDLPGFGGTTDIAPVGGPDELAAFVARVLDSLSIDRAVVFGVSMGGDVALNLALARPQLVSALVLIGPGGLVPRLKDPLTHTAAWLASRLPDWALLPAARVANLFVRASLRAIVRDPDTLPTEVVDEFVRESRAPHGGIAYGRYNQATLGRTKMLNNLLPQVAGIDAPTLIFHGEHDPLVDPAGSKRAAELMPNARLVLAPDTGHWAQLEAHDLFIEKVAGFLDELPRNRP